MPTLMPVYSPLPFAAILSGMRALVSSASAARARGEVEEWLKRGDPRREVLLLDSGTSALTLALRATASSVGRPVAIPAFACYDIATAVDGADVPFVFYDLDPTTLGPDFRSLRKALEGGADRIVAVHLFGIPVDLDALNALAAEFDALVIEDAAQGAGGSWRGTPLGFNGSLGVLSFGRGKGITGGAGGALVGNDERGRRLVREGGSEASGNQTSAREVVATVVQSVFARRSLYWLPASLPFLSLGETHYREALPIRSMSSFAAGVLRVTTRLAPAESARRREQATTLRARCADAGLWMVSVSPVGEAGYLRLPTVTDADHGGTATASMQRVGVMPSYPLALPDLPGFGTRASSSDSECAGARRLATRLLTLPVHGGLHRRDQDAIVKWRG